VFRHFLHGNEADSSRRLDGYLLRESCGYGDAAGIGALGVSAGLIVEETQFTVHHVLLEGISPSANKCGGMEPYHLS